MIEETEGHELAPWQCLYNYDNMITRACMRLDQIRDSERVLGYEESAQMYHETSVALRQERVWYRKAFEEAVGDKLSDDDAEIMDLGWC